MYFMNFHGKHFTSSSCKSLFIGGQSKAAWAAQSRFRVSVTFRSSHGLRPRTDGVGVPPLFSQGGG